MFPMLRAGSSRASARRPSPGAGSTAPPPQQAVGPRPEIPARPPQGAAAEPEDADRARLGRRTARRSPAPGLKVNAFAAGLKHPRWLYVLPNGDVLAAEALQQDQPVKSLFDYAMVTTMRRANGARRQPQPHHPAARRRRRRRRRDARRLSRRPQPAVRHGAGRRHVLCRQHRRPRRLSVRGRARRSSRGAGRKLASFKPGGHWTRSLLATPDGAALYVGVGSHTNIADEGFAAEEGRAAIHRYDIASGRCEMFASGLRNPVGLAFEPTTGALWTVVNERDGLGDETPPDYLTTVREGGFYGWPYCYWDRVVDDRVPAEPGDGREGDRSRISRSAATRPRSASAGCRPACCPASATAW